MVLFPGAGPCCVWPVDCIIHFSLAHKKYIFFSTFFSLIAQLKEISAACSFSLSDPYQLPFQSEPRAAWARGASPAPPCAQPLDGVFLQLLVVDGKPGRWGGPWLFPLAALAMHPLGYRSCWLQRVASRSTACPQILSQEGLATLLPSLQAGRHWLCTISKHCWEEGTKHSHRTEFCHPQGPGEAKSWCWLNLRQWLRSLQMPAAQG